MRIIVISITSRIQDSLTNTARKKKCSTPYWDFLFQTWLKKLNSGLAWSNNFRFKICWKKCIFIYLFYLYLYCNLAVSVHSRPTSLFLHSRSIKCHKNISSVTTLIHIRGRVFPSTISAKFLIFDSTGLARHRKRLRRPWRGNPTV